MEISEMRLNIDCTSGRPIASSLHYPLLGHTFLKSEQDP